MNTLLRWLFFNLLIRPLVLIVLGLNVRRRDLLPTKGPAVVVANHNSHLDTMVLMTLFPNNLLGKIRPVAAIDYFFANRWIRWFASEIVRIIPFERRKNVDAGDRFEAVSAALENDEIVIFFPEGTRGEPEALSEFKKGISHLAERHPHVPIIPVFMHGLGKALPAGEALLVPFFCDVFVGTPQYFECTRNEFMDNLNAAMCELAGGIN